MKKIDPERVSHRQERVELSVSEFVQNLLLEDSDMTESTVYAQIVEVYIITTNCIIVVTIGGICN